MQLFTPQDYFNKGGGLRKGADHVKSYKGGHSAGNHVDQGHHVDSTGHINKGHKDRVRTLYIYPLKGNNYVTYSLHVSNSNICINMFFLCNKWFIYPLIVENSKFTHPT